MHAASQHNRGGFTLIEIMVVITIIGILLAISVPTFRRQTPFQQRKELVAKLNELTFSAWKNSIATDRLHKIEFNFTDNTVQIFQATLEKADNPDEQAFERVGGAVEKDSISWPEEYRVINFFINDSDEMTRGERETVWFFVVPNGLTQPVIINFIDEPSSEAKDVQVDIGLVLNPFYAQFKEYNGFQQP